jgi:hypothetical protein
MGHHAATAVAFFLAGVARAQEPCACGTTTYDDETTATCTAAGDPHYKVCPTRLRVAKASLLQ